MLVVKKCSPFDNCMELPTFVSTKVIPWPTSRSTLNAAGHLCLGLSFWAALDTVLHTVRGRGQSASCKVVIIFTETSIRYRVTISSWTYLLSAGYWDIVHLGCFHVQFMGTFLFFIIENFPSSFTKMSTNNSPRGEESPCSVNPWDEGSLHISFWNFHSKGERRTQEGECKFQNKPHRTFDPGISSNPLIHTIRCCDKCVSDAEVHFTPGLRVTCFLSENFHVPHKHVYQWMIPRKMYFWNFTKKSARAQSVFSIAFDAK